MKRYMLFLMPSYYPHGGMQDFIHSDDDLMTLVEYSTTWVAPKKGRFDHMYMGTTQLVYKECFGHIFDLKENVIVLWKACDKGWTEECYFDVLYDDDDD